MTGLEDHLHQCPGPVNGWNGDTVEVSHMGDIWNCETVEKNKHFCWHFAICCCYPEIWMLPSSSYPHHSGHVSITAHFRKDLHLPGKLRSSTHLGNLSIYNVSQNSKRSLWKSYTINHIIEPPFSHHLINHHLTAILPLLTEVVKGFSEIHCPRGLQSNASGRPWAKKPAGGPAADRPAPMAPGRRPAKWRSSADREDVCSMTWCTWCGP